jgi:hypothetical protein
MTTGPAGRALIALTLLLCYFASSAQDYRPGFRVGIDGDTVKGLVRYATAKRSEKRCLFKPSKGAVKTVYSPADIQGYGIFGDRYYETIADPKDGAGMFARVLSSGQLGLLLAHHQFFLRRDTVELLPPPVKIKIAVANGQAFRTEKPYAGVLNIALSDCSIRADELPYSEKELTVAVDQYNRCKDPNFQSMQRRKAFQIGMSAFTSYIYSDMSLKFDQVSIDASTFLAYGIGVDLYSPRIFDKLSLALDVTYGKSFYQGLISGPSSGYYLREDVFMNFTSIRLAAAVRYSFLDASHTPYLKFGFADYAVIKDDIRILTEKELAEGMVITSKSSGGFGVKNPKGIYVGLGYQHSVNKKIKCFVEGRYENLEGYIGTAIQSFSDMRNYNATFGLRIN